MRLTTTHIASCFTLLFASAHVVANESTYDRSEYAHLDPARLVPQEALEKAIQYFDTHRGEIENQRYMSVIDFTKHSGQKRFYVIDMLSGDVEALHTSHGRGSDSDHNGFADQFSNKNNSHMSSVGFYMTNETYYGEHGYSLRLDGLSNTNSNARKRAIVIHGAKYVSASLNKMGRSFGCPALSLDTYKRIINKIKGGSLIFAWSDDKSI